MLFMDLVVNNTLLYQGQVALGQAPIQDPAYLGFDGVLMFIDTLGLLDPQWEDLNTRYFLVYLSENTPVTIPLQPAPVQNLAVVLNNQNCFIGLYDQLIATDLPNGAALPVGADATYLRQSCLATP